MKKNEQLLNKKPEGPLYHYTSQEGIMGILLNTEIWASKIQYLNDSKELTHCSDLIKNRLEERFNYADKPFKDKIVKAISGVEQTNIFAASFSEEGDLLSQWRAYCPKSGGYNIGFYYSDLEILLDYYDINILPCVYSLTEQIELVDELLLSYLETFESDIDPLIDSAISFRKQFLKLAPLLKHTSFEEEKEWRIVSNPLGYDDDNVKYRVGNSMIIPYLSMQYPKRMENFPFHKITIGPTPHPNLAEHSIYGLLFKNKSFKKRAIESKTCISKIPYRTW